MDGCRFDAWTKALLAVSTRRAALRLVTGGAAGLAWLGLVEDAAACRKTGKKCTKNKQCCTKRCKGKKCRCKPLQAKCPPPFNDLVCCPSGGTPGCFTVQKPQCGPAEVRCLLRTEDPCEADCDCASDLVCAGGPNSHCCWAPGHECEEGTNDYICCSLECGCESPTGDCYCRNEGCKSPGPGATCTQNIQCCDGICQSGECCLPQGIACTGTAQCCAGLFCDAGFCDTP